MNESHVRSHINNIVEAKEMKIYLKIESIYGNGTNKIEAKNRCYILQITQIISFRMLSRMNELNHIEYC